MKNTIQKQAVLAAVLNMKNHPTAEEVYGEVKKENDSVGIATVYRNLNSFVEKGQISKVAVQNAPDRFDFRLDKHQHLLCDTCGKVCDVDADVRIDIKEKDIDITSYQIFFSGVCSNCR